MAEVKLAFISAHVGVYAKTPGEVPGTNRLLVGLDADGKAWEYVQDGTGRVPDHWRPLAMAVKAD